MSFARLIVARRANAGRRMREAREVAVTGTEKTFGKMGLHMKGDLQRNAFTGGTTADRLKVRSGQTRASLNSRVMRGSAGAVAAFVGSPRIAAAVAGSPTTVTVRPKRARMLTVPLPAALTPSGVLRQPARRIPGLFVLRALSGKVFLAKREGKGLVFYFRLMDQVQIAGRDAWRKRFAAQRENLKRIGGEIVVKVREAVARAG